MFVIGIGSSLNRDELAAVASDPDNEHLFYYGFNDLSAFVDQMSTTSCNGKVAQIPSAFLPFVYVWCEWSSIDVKALFLLLES